MARSSSFPSNLFLLVTKLYVFFSHVKISDLEREIQSQKEHRLMYRKRMERTQDYVRYCLQIAQENGFLHLIIKNKDDQQGVLYSNIVSTSPLPLMPTPVHQNSDLAAIINQAKLNGWYIDPNEVSLSNRSFFQNTHTRAWCWYFIYLYVLIN